MQVLKHHIYEYRKGLRRLILFTCRKNQKEQAIEILEKRKIPYILMPIHGNNVNIFFGDLVCLDVIRNIDKHSLNAYTPEEDFILGIMLGYDRKQQCERFLTRKINKQIQTNEQLQIA